MSRETWEPTYSPWRHGGWYVDNVHYPSGSVGCVSNNYPDKRWRIACGPHELTFSTRRDAAVAEKLYVDGLKQGAAGAVTYEQRRAFAQAGAK